MDIGLGYALGALAAIAFYGVTAILEATGVLHPTDPPAISGPADCVDERAAAP